MNLTAQLDASRQRRPRAPRTPQATARPARAGIADANGQITAGAVLVVVGLVGATTSFISGPVLLISAALVCVAAVLGSIGRPGGWLAPLGFPLLYVTAVHTIPLLMADRYVFEGQTATVVNGVVTPDMATDGTTRALGLFLIGFVSVSLLLVFRTLPPQEIRAILDKPRPAAMEAALRSVGRATLLAAIALQGLYFARNGFQRKAPTPFDKELTTMGRILLFAGVVCTVAAFGQRSKGLRSIGPRDLSLVAVACLLAATWGSRSALLAPGLVLAFALAVRKPKGQRQVLYLGVAGLLIFVLLAETRIKGTENLSGFSVETIVERTVRDLNAPTYLTYYTNSALNSGAGFERANGSTYLAAFPHLAPSAVTDLAGVELPKLATERYREMIYFDSADRGFGLAPVAEAVMNFGAKGALLAGAVFGLAMTGAYRWMALTAGNLPRYWLYPVLFASLPWAVRSDTLQGLKPVLYAMAALVVGTWLGRVRGAREATFR